MKIDLPRAALLAIALALSAGVAQAHDLSQDEALRLSREGVIRPFEEILPTSGKSVSFLTGLCLLNSQSGRSQVDCVPFTVHFRDLDEARIRRYLEAEQPFDCAGSFKAEGLGVSLFRATEGEDATSLIGLSLIRLVDMLLAEQVLIP